NTITFAGNGGANGGLIMGGTATINANLQFGSNSPVSANEALIYTANNSTTTMSGDLTVTSNTGNNGTITKFGTGILLIGKDQTTAARGAGNGFSGNWVINQGQLTLNTFGGAGDGGTITL